MQDLGIFYMGINLGAFLAPLVVGTVGMKYNFHLGFGIAAIGMFFGLLVFIGTKKRNLGLAGTHVPNPLSADEKKKVFTWGAIGAAVIALLVLIGSWTNVLTIDLYSSHSSAFSVSSFQRFISS
ncbi:MAG: hypothetical protein KatS3mg080_0065 [Anoxybacillus sp.]|nr:MAG: hypothetical protein KatS3mg080_0065 [Anoxybacillus sp.]